VRWLLKVLCRMQRTYTRAGVECSSAQVILSIELKNVGSRCNENELTT
jgi:hypothetical protein